MADGSTTKTITCLDTGNYDSGPAMCDTQPGCPIPMDDDVNRQHNYQGDDPVPVGTFITFTCKKPFFDASGVKEKTIECLPDGTYDDTPPQCDQPGCDLPMDGSRASNNYPGVSAPVDIDTQVTYTCNSGYTMADGSTTKTITCLDTGNYDSGPAMCDTQPGCPIPMDDDVNRQHNYQGDDPVPVGTFITFTCKKPFFDASGVKEKTIECLPDGTYDDTPPQCDQPGCDLPMDGSRASNNYPGVSAPVDFGIQVTYTCNSGYTMADGSTTKTITCLDTGNYDSGPAMCDTQPGCPIPMDDDVNRQHNYQGDDPVPVGTFITFTCRMPFFDVSGVKEKTIECLPDGTYDDTPPQCDQPGCDLPMDGSRASNNYPGVSAPVDIDTQVTYTCNSGYTMADGSTTKTITCLDTGNYDSGPAMCDTQPGCPIPMDDDVNRQHNYQGDDPVPVGTFITFTCRMPFFDVSGVKEKTIECLPDGTYDDTPPQCDQPGCDLPMDGSRASNNYPGVIAPVDFGTQVIYNCNSGYTMADGSTTKTITCLDAGNYDSGPAMCDTRESGFYDCVCFNALWLN
ncbi:CUB and sushi domain-containing protein 3-like isoform X2 [Lingula anatina]|uniref:CUB and sushi domain-containing protein 3-like isoform X2 n=1 Tax=Lingula anatina TaxID=7574 RepID=A0A1S3J820_LINAN|nr:CUB and sushi domain-containing protein 3-like isoform X2 [Lingula anatina]|eukprot:XP_013406545.1 CUB and sushi domain-containing protein 3-like isoform X2 [Lingula anatina]